MAGDSQWPVKKSDGGGGGGEGSMGVVISGLLSSFKLHLVFIHKLKSMREGRCLRGRLRQLSAAVGH